MIESPIEDYVVGRAEKAGWLARKLKWIGRRNGPDRFFAKGGRVVLIEFKRPGKAPRTGQAREAIRLKDAGVEVHAVDSVATALRILGIPLR